MKRRRSRLTQSERHCSARSTRKNTISRHAVGILTPIDGLGKPEPVINHGVTRYIKDVRITSTKREGRLRLPVDDVGRTIECDDVIDRLWRFSRDETIGRHIRRIHQTEFVRALIVDYRYVRTTRASHDETGIKFVRGDGIVRADFDNRVCDTLVFNVQVRRFALYKEVTIDREVVTGQRV